WDTLQGWKNAGEKATWQLTVSQPGDYRVSLRYGCRPLDAGGKIRISSGDAALEHQIEATTTADQFQDFEAGTLTLGEGEIELVAEVVEAPGKELMRLNEIVLVPLE